MTDEQIRALGYTDVEIDGLPTEPPRRHAYLIIERYREGDGDCVYSLAKWDPDGLAIALPHADGFVVVHTLYPGIRSHLDGKYRKVRFWKMLEDLNAEPEKS